MQQKLQNKANTLLLVFQREWMFKGGGGGGEKYSQALKINKTLHSPSGIMCIHDGFFLFAVLFAMFAFFIYSVHFFICSIQFFLCSVFFLFAAIVCYSQRSLFYLQHFFYFKCSLFFFNHLQAFFSVPSIHCFHFVVFHCPVHCNKF